MPTAKVIALLSHHHHQHDHILRLANAVAKAQGRCRWLLCPFSQLWFFYSNVTRWFLSITSLLVPKPFPSPNWQEDKLLILHYAAIHTSTTRDLLLSQIFAQLQCPPAQKRALLPSAVSTPWHATCTYDSHLLQKKFYILCWPHNDWHTIRDCAWQVTVPVADSTKVSDFVRKVDRNLNRASLKFENRNDFAEYQKVTLHCICRQPDYWINVLYSFCCEFLGWPAFHWAELLVVGHGATPPGQSARIVTTLTATRACTFLPLNAQISS